MTGGTGEFCKTKRHSLDDVRPGGGASLRTGGTGQFCKTKRHSLDDVRPGGGASLSDRRKWGVL